MDARDAAALLRQAVAVPADAALIADSGIAGADVADSEPTLAFVAGIVDIVDRDCRRGRVAQAHRAGVAARFGLATAVDRRAVDAPRW
jgi:hypothetical protein